MVDRESRAIPCVSVPLGAQCIKQRFSLDVGLTDETYSRDLTPQRLHCYQCSYFV
eukprot:m.97884 g.97884  ORF g.97884 m.97884 type:complete len:55 (-) comp14846_c1_seq1:40-204(-)